MISKYFIGALAVAILLAVASVPAFAQLGELRGSVFMENNGQKTPLADAKIDVYRTDIKGQYDTKTNKKGEFVFAGLPFTGTYTVVASHATARANFVPGVTPRNQPRGTMTSRISPIVTPASARSSPSSLSNSRK